MHTTSPSSSLRPPLPFEMDRIEAFAVVAPGLEPYATREARALGLTVLSEEPGGFTFSGGLEDVYRANLWLRTASRITVRFARFFVLNFPELRKKASRLPWDNFLRPGQPVDVRVTCHRSKLYHQRAVAERLAGAISDHFSCEAPMRKAGEEDADPPQGVFVRMVDNECILSIDTSGELLHRRGYRQAVGKAPLRETLAAGLLMASGWDAASPLVDPFCGSGTIAIEAALLARRMAPGRHRRFAFMQWPGFDAAVWARLCAEADGQRVVGAPPIYGFDRDAGAIEAARANAERAGVAGDLQCACLAVSHLVAPAGAGWLVTNPPYGIRVSQDRDLRNLYARFGQVMRERFPGWRVALLCPDPMLSGHMGLPLGSAALLSHGGLKVAVLVGGPLRS